MLRDEVSNTGIPAVPKAHKSENGLHNIGGVVESGALTSTRNNETADSFSVHEHKQNMVTKNMEEVSQRATFDSMLVSQQGLEHRIASQEALIVILKDQIIGLKRSVEVCFFS